jgi:hypothetical protein
LVAWLGREAYEEALLHQPCFWQRARDGSTELPADLPDLAACSEVAQADQAAAMAMAMAMAGDTTPAAAQRRGDAYPALHRATRHTGWCALNQVMHGPLQALRARLHLLAGPDSARAVAQQPWPIAGPALVQHLCEHFAPQPAQALH